MTVITRRLAVLSLDVCTSTSWAATSSVGATAGSFAVSPSGSATYTVPITVPPGVSNMQPNISLSYDSQSGNGLLGVGWNIAGLSVFHRCGASIDRDGFNGGVNLDGNDKFCLDGQRLPAQATTSVACSNCTEYRTDPETFARIVSYGTQGNGPQGWRVWTRSGQILEYGKLTDEPIAAPESRIAVSPTSSTVIAWPVNVIKDTVGNYLTVSYITNTTASPASVEYRPTRIDYTGNMAAGMVTSRSVQFEYETTTRPDPITNYVGGVAMNTTRRLTHVYTYSGSTWVRDYRIAYEAQLSAATGRSRLTSVQECAGDGTGCINPTNVAWSDSSTFFSFPGSTATGFTDASGWNSDLRFFQMDVNGDGRGDLVARNAAGDLIVMLSNGGGFTYAGLTATDFTDASGWNSDLRFFQMDVNGDGRGDLVARNAAGDLIVMLSNGSGFTYAGSTATGYSDAYGWNSGLRFFQMDVNGDGKTDFVARDGSGNLIVWLANINGTGFAYAGATVTSYSDAYGWNSGLRFFQMDVNGDGKTDFVERDGSGNLIVWLANGMGFTYAGATASTLTDAAGFNDGLRFFQMDVNGDGKGDLVARYADGALASVISTGTFPDLLSTVTNGLAAQINNISFKPLTDTTVYSKETSASYPVMDLQGPMYVVASYQASNGLGGLNTTSYSYTGAKVHQQGRGNLGFHTITQTVPTGIKTTIIYGQTTCSMSATTVNMSCIGLPLRVDASLGNTT